MVREGGGNRQNRGGIWILLVVGALLGYRSYRAMNATLSTKPEVAAASAAAVDERLNDLREISLRDSLVAEAHPTDRDPFRIPPRTEGVRRVSAVGRLLDHPAAPVLRALLFDRINPSVQLSLGERTSPWMQMGDQFKGWTVMEITPTSVELSCEGKRIVLSSS